MGVVGPCIVTHGRDIKEVLPEATLQNFTREMLQLRFVKSEEEIDFLRKGAEFSDRAIEALEREVRPGISELQLVAIVEGAYLGLGGKTHIHYMPTTPMQNPTVCVPARIHPHSILENADDLIP